MAGRVSRDDQVVAEINVTPLVDIMLVLLIIFMLTSEEIAAKVQQPAIEVDLPTASSGGQHPPTPLTVLISKSGELYCNGARVDENALKLQARQAHAATPKLQAVVSADQRVAHGVVIHIVDILRLEQIEQVAINTKALTIE